MGMRAAGQLILQVKSSTITLSEPLKIPGMFFLLGGGRSGRPDINMKFKIFDQLFWE